MSEKIYTWLLKLYPVRFRRDYGPSAVQLFRDRFQAERGLLRRCRFWLDVISDLAVSVPREHWRRNTTEPRMPGAFRIPEEAVAEMTKREAVIPAIAIGSLVALGLTIAWLGDSRHVPMLIAYLPLAILTMAQFRTIVKVERRLHSYQLIFGPNHLQLSQDGEDRTVSKSEIFKVNEDQHGLSVICVPGYSRAEALPVEYRQEREGLVSIPIPAGLTGYEQIREQILQWTGPISQRRSLGLKKLKPLACAVSLGPAMLLVSSVPWLAIVAVIYYGTVLLAIVLDIGRPPRGSGLAREGVNLPRSAYMWRRFKRLSRCLGVLTLFFLPIVRIVPLP
jgi:hypothetical protein